MADIATVAIALQTTGADEAADSLRNVKEAAADTKEAVRALQATVQDFTAAGDKQKQTISDSIERLQAQRLQIQGNSGEVEAYKARMDGLSESVQKYVMTLANENQILKAEIQAENELAAAAQKSIDIQNKYISTMEQRVAGMIATNEQLALSKARELELNEAQTAHVQAMGASIDSYKKGQAAGEGFTNMTAGARRELIVLGHEVMTGNFSRIPGSLVVMAERFGSLNAMIGTLLNPINLIGGAVVVMGLATVKAFMDGAKESEQFANTLALTNNAVGLTIGGMHDLSAEIANTTTLTIGQSKELANHIAQTGQFTATTVKEITTLTAEYGQATGESLKVAGDKMTKAFEDPAKGVLELNHQLNALTFEEEQHIIALAKTGDLLGAQQELYEKLQSRLKEIPGNLGTIETALISLKKWWSDMWDAALNIGRTETPEQKLKNATKALEDFKSGTLVVNDKIVALSNTITGVPFAQFIQNAEKMKNAVSGPDPEKLAALQQAVDLARNQLRVQSEAAAVQGDLTQKQRERNAVLEDNAKLMDSLHTKGEQYMADLTIAAKALAEGGITVEQYDAEVAKIEKRYRDVKAPVDAFLNQQIKLTDTINAHIKTVKDEIAALEDGDKVRAKVTAGDQELAKIEEELKGHHNAAEVAVLRVNEALAKHQSELEHTALAMKDYMAESKKLQTELDNEVKKFQERAQKAEDEAKSSELVKDAADREVLARLQEKMAIELNSVALGELTDRKMMEIAATAQEIEAVQRLISAKVDLANHKEFQEEAKKAEEAWQHTFKSVEDGLLHVFEKGKNIFQDLVKYIENQAIKFFLQPVVAPIAGAVASIFNPTAASAVGASPLGALGQAGSAVANWFGGGSAGVDMAGFSTSSSLGAGFFTPGAAVDPFAVTASSTGGMILPGVSPALDASAGNMFGGYGALTSDAAATDALATSAGLGSTALEGAASAATTAGTSLASLGSAAMSALPYVGAIVGLYSLAKSLTGGETRQGGQYGWGLTHDGIYGTGSSTFIQGPSGGQIGGDQVTKSIDSTIATLNKMITDLGGSATVAGFQAGLESSTEGRGGVYAGGILSTGATFGLPGLGQGRSNYNGTLYDPTKSTSPNSQQAAQDFALELQQSIIQGLQAADLGGIVGKYLKGVGDVSKIDSSTASTIISTVEALKQLGDLFKSWPISNLATASDEAKLALVQLAGGAQNLTNATANFYSKFFSAQEQQAAALKGTTDQVHALGGGFATLDLSAADAREQFKNLVLGIDLSTAAGQQQYIQAIALANAVDAVTAKYDDQAAVAEGLATKLTGFDATSLGKSLSDSILNASDAADAGTRFANAFGDQFVQTMTGVVTSAVAKVVFDSIITPQINAAATQANIIITGGSTAGTAMQTGGIVAGASLTDAVGAIKKYLDIVAKVLADPTVQDALKQIQPLLSQVGSSTYTALGGLMQYRAPTAPTTSNSSSAAAQKAANDLDTFLDGIEQQLAAITQSQAAQKLAAINKGYDDNLKKLTDLGAATTQNIALITQLQDAQRAQLGLATRTALINAQGRQDVTSAEALAKATGDYAIAAAQASAAGVDLTKVTANDTKAAYDYWNTLSKSQQEAAIVAADAKTTLITAETAKFNAELKNITDLQNAITTVQGFINSIDDNMLKLKVDMGQLTSTQALDQQIARSKKNLDNLAATGAATSDLINEAQNLMNLQMQRYDAEKTAITDMYSYATQLGDYVKNLLTGSLSTLSPEAKLAEAKSQYEATLAAAKSGDATAKQQLTTQADTLLKLGQSYFASSQGYVDIFNKVTTDLKDFGADTRSAADIQAAQLASLNQNAQATLNILQGYKDIATAYQASLQNQLGAQLVLLQQDTAFLSQLGADGAIASAIRALPNSIAAAIQGALPVGLRTGVGATGTAGRIGGVDQGADPLRNGVLQAMAASGDWAGAAAQAASYGYSGSQMAAIFNSATGNNVTGDQIVAWAKQAGIKGFASGGGFGGGMRLVGEHGPELEVTGPSHIFNATDTNRLLRQSTDQVSVAALLSSNLQELKGIRSDIKQQHRDDQTQVDKVAQATIKAQNDNTAALHKVRDELILK